MADADLDLLATYLDSPGLPDEVMTLSELDGFLAAIAAGPVRIAPEEWLPFIWDTAPPAFAGEAQAAAVTGAIHRLYADIVRLVADGTYAPLLDTDIDGVPLPHGWARGFMTAAGLRVEAWSALFQSEDDDSIAYPILAFCDDEDGKPLLQLSHKDREILLPQSPDLIAQAVIDIADYWQQKNKPLPPGAVPVRTSPKIGRNAPCPCGSGKKYKKCCGA